MTTWKPINRPAAPYRMPEGDIDTFRKMYKADEYKGINSPRDLLEEAYQEFKRTSKKAKGYPLPKTFKEVLDQEEGNREGDKTPATFPQWLYFGVIGKANMILDDTETAKATLAYLDGEELKEGMNPPNVLSNVQYKIKDIENANMPTQVYVNTMNLDFFTHPEKLLSEWIEDSETDKNRQEIEAFREAVTKKTFNHIVSNIAKKTGDDEKQLKDPKKRTAEQKALLLTALRKAIAARNEAVWKSVLMQTFYYCRDVEKKTKLRADTVKTVLNFAVAYYYTMHPEKDYTVAADPKEARDGAEAAEIYNEMLSFVEKREQGTSVFAAVYDFIDSKTQPEADKKEIKERITKTVSTLDTFANMLHGNAVNDFMSTGNKQIKQDIQAGTYQAEKNDTIMTFDAGVNLSPNLRKFYMALLIQLTSQIPYRETDANKIEKARRVSFSVYDYMNWTGTKDRTAAYKHINEAAETLLKTTKEFPVTIYEKDRKGKYVPQKKIRKMNILEAIDRDDKDGKAIKDGKVTLYFSFLMAQALSHAHIMKIPTALLKINSKRNPHGVNLGYKLAYHYGLNAKKKNKNANLIKVKSLLSFCPEIPSYEEVMANMKGKVDEKIINPLTRDLDANQEAGVLSEWHYCDTNGKELTDEQLGKYKYSDWIEWQVYFELKDYPSEKKN